jgi:alkaline phosphatase
MNPMTKHHLTFLSAPVLAFALAAPVVAESPDGWYRDGRDADCRAPGSHARYPAGAQRDPVRRRWHEPSPRSVPRAFSKGSCGASRARKACCISNAFRTPALSKTYNTNQQTPDSAGTMTAMVTGVKTFAGSIAIDQRARRTAIASRLAAASW